MFQKGVIKLSSYTRWTNLIKDRLNKIEPLIDNIASSIAQTLLTTLRIKLYAYLEEVNNKFSINLARVLEHATNEEFDV